MKLNRTFISRLAGSLFTPSMERNPSGVFTPVQKILWNGPQTARPFINRLNGCHFERSVFKWSELSPDHSDGSSKSRPLDIWMSFNRLNTRLVWNSDGFCTLVFNHNSLLIRCCLCHQLQVRIHRGSTQGHILGEKWGQSSGQGPTRRYSLPLTYCPFTDRGPSACGKWQLRPSQCQLLGLRFYERMLWIWAWLRDQGWLPNDGSLPGNSNRFLLSPFFVIRCVASLCQQIEAILK